MNTVISTRKAQFMQSWRQHASKRVNKLNNINRHKGEQDSFFSATFSRLYHQTLKRESDDDDHRDRKPAISPLSPLHHTSMIKFARAFPFMLPLSQPNHHVVSSLNKFIPYNTNIRNSRLFSTGHPTANNHNQHEEKQENITRKQQIQNAAHQGQKAVKKGAHSIKDLIAKHGLSFVGTYFTLWLTIYGAVFGALDSGLIDPMTLMNIELPWHSGAEASEQDAADAEEIHSAIDYVASKMKNFKLTEPYADYVKDNPRISNLAIAFIATKLTEPVRIGVTLAIVPKVSRMRGIKVDDDEEPHVPPSSNATDDSKMKGAVEKIKSDGQSNN